jgi:hypothetical protein
LPRSLYICAFETGIRSLAFVMVTSFMPSVGGGALFRGDFRDMGSNLRLGGLAWGESASGDLHKGSTSTKRSRGRITFIDAQIINVNDYPNWPLMIFPKVLPAQ